MLYNLNFFFSSKCRLFHNATLFGFCIAHILNTGCAKLWKKIRRQKVNAKNCELYPHIVFSCPVGRLQETATVPLYSTLRLVFLMEGKPCHARGNKWIFIITWTNCSLQTLNEAFSNDVSMNIEWRRTWKKAVITHDSVQSKCLPRDTESYEA